MMLQIDKGGRDGHGMGLGWAGGSCLGRTDMVDLLPMGPVIFDILWSSLNFIHAFMLLIWSMVSANFMHASILLIWSVVCADLMHAIIIRGRNFFHKYPFLFSREFSSMVV